MAYQIIWVVEKRVMLTTFSGIITQPELERFINEVRAEIPKGTPMVYHISNSLALEKVEFSLKSLQVLVRAYKMAAELGWQIDVNRNPINRMFANFATQFANVRTRTFPTLEEAIAFLQRTDESLADAVWQLDAPPISSIQVTQ